MSGKTRKITVAAMLAALSAAVLYAASLIPYAEAALAGLAGLFTAAAVIECGIPAGIGCYIVSAVLGLILSPVKTPAALYAVFLGYYPIAKSFFERCGKVLEWALKLLLMNAALTAAVLILGFGFIADFEPSPLIIAGVYLLMNVCFVIYDIAFSRLIGTYMRRIHRKK